jgi:hypothetical protein
VKDGGGWDAWKVSSRYRFSRLPPSCETLSLTRAYTVTPAARTPHPSKHAVGVPLFAASTEYDDAETKAQSGSASAAEQSAIVATSARILALSAEQNAKARFESFRIGYAICMLLIAGGLIFSAVSLPATPDPVTKPAKVSLVMPPGNEARFVAATGCQSLATTTAVAVGGLWNRPRLRLVGQGCPLGDWTPTPDLNGVIVPG